MFTQRVCYGYAYSFEWLILFSLEGVGHMFAWQVCLYLHFSSVCVVGPYRDLLFLASEVEDGGSQARHVLAHFSLSDNR